MTGRVRRWLRLGPSRAELIAQVRAGVERCETEMQKSNAAFARIRALGKMLDVETARADRLSGQVSELLVVKLNEPDRAEGCDKIRFHGEGEARDFAARIAAANFEPDSVVVAYQCRRKCPRSPVTMRPYWHIGHLGSEEAQRVKRASQNARAERRKQAEDAGLLLGQRIGPEALMKLSAMTHNHREETKQ
jgi:hypothetical protein